MGSALGLNGGYGAYSSPNIDWNAIQKANEQSGNATNEYGTLAGTEKARQAATEQMSPAIADIISKNQNVTDYLGSLNNQRFSGVSDDRQGAAQQAALSDLATNGLTGSKLAGEQVQQNPLLAQIFGKGGTFENTAKQQADLANRGFSLQPEDYEAYGQASGQLARLFGGQEQGLSQSLSDRGFGQAASGMAGAGFSGLQGNKNEQLAGLQRQIADNRMQMNLQRLGQTNQLLSQLSGQAGSELSNQYNRQLQGANMSNQERQNMMNNFANTAGLYNQQAGQNIGQAQAGFGMQTAADQAKNAAKMPSLGEMFGAGLMSSAYGIGSSPGTAFQYVASGGKYGGDTKKPKTTPTDDTATPTKDTTSAATKAPIEPEP